MERLTTNKNVLEMNMNELAHNSCYIKDCEARYRDYDVDIDARELTIMLLDKFADIPNEFISDEDFDNFMLESLQYEIGSCFGLIAVFYKSLWAMADLRERLKEYEDLQDKLDKQFNGHVSMAMIIDAIIEYDKQLGRDEAVADAMMLTNKSVRKYREWKSLEEQGRMMKLPVPIGGTVYEKDSPMHPNRVIGYRIGRMMGEDAEDYEEDGYDDGEWHIECARSGTEFSAPVSAIGEYIFLTREEAEQAPK